MNKLKLLFLRFFNREKYKNYLRFDSIIKYGKSSHRGPSASLNYNCNYNAFCNFMIEEGWIKEEVTIQNDNNDEFDDLRSEFIIRKNT